MEKNTTVNMLFLRSVYYKCIVCGPFVDINPGPYLSGFHNYEMDDFLMKSKRHLAGVDSITYDGHVESWFIHLSLFYHVSCVFCYLVK